MVIEFTPSRKSILCYLFEHCRFVGTELYDYSDAVLLNIWQQQVAIRKVQEDIVGGVGWSVTNWTDHTL